MDLSSMIRREIDRQGVSGYAIAKATGISEASLSRFRRKKGELTAEHAGKVMKFLGFKVSPPEKAKS